MRVYLTYVIFVENMDIYKRENCELKAQSAAGTSGVNSNSDKSEHLSSDAAMQPVEGNIAEDGMRGSWMNVPSRRKPKPVGIDLSRNVVGVNDKGSRFNALAQVNEELGNNSADFRLSNTQINSRPANHVHEKVELAPKVWTKSKSTKSVERNAFLILI